MCFVLPKSRTERSDELPFNPATMVPIQAVIEYHLFRYIKKKKNLPLVKENKFNEVIFILWEVCSWCVTTVHDIVHPSEPASTDLRWKDFLSHSNPHRQLGPCDYSRPLLSTHLFECKAFLIHPKKGFKRGLYRW